MPVSPFSRYRQLSQLELHHPKRGSVRSLPIRRVYAPTEERSQTIPQRHHLYSGYDTADLLALNYFGREDLYWYLLDANDGQLPDELEVGQRLAIPPLSLATRIERPGR